MSVIICDLLHGDCPSFLEHYKAEMKKLKEELGRKEIYFPFISLDKILRGQKKKVIIYNKWHIICP